MPYQNWWPASCTVTPSGVVTPGGREPARAGGEQRRVLHAAGAALERGIDDRDVAVRIGAEPLAVVLQRRARRVEVALGLRRVLGLEQQPHLDRRQPRMLEARGPHEVVRARRPREVVDVVLVVAVGRRAVARCRGARARTPVAPSGQPAGTVSDTS